MKEQRFTVYMVDHIVFGDGHTNVNKTRLQSTTAKSEDDAVNKVKSSLKISLFQSYGEGRYRQSHLVAVKE